MNVTWSFQFNHDSKALLYIILYKIISYSNLQPKCENIASTSFAVCVILSYLFCYNQHAVKNIYILPIHLGQGTLTYAIIHPAKTNFIILMAT